MQTTTMGALYCPVTPFHTTIRPTGLSVTDDVVHLPPPPAVPHVNCLPPPAPTEEQVPDLAHSIFHHRPSPQGVIQAIVLAYTIDKSADQPYKPEPDTTFREALLHLKAEGYILIHGGRIDATFSDLYHLTMWEDRVRHHITRDEVMELLECNYPNDQVMPPPTEEDIYDTIPCSPPKPMPWGGVGMYALYSYGVDIDYIHPDDWKPITFPHGIAHQVLYMGDLMIDDQLADVWYSLPLDCYLAQFLSREELARRFPWEQP